MYFLNYVYILIKINMSKSKKLKTTPRQKFSKGFLLKDTSGVQWEIQKIIGSGGFGYVYCGQWV